MSCQIFFCGVAKDDIRKGISEACFSRWLQSHKVVYRPAALGVSGFQTAHRIICEATSRSTIYIKADDDCMPLGERFVERALEVMERHPEYGLLAFGPTCGNWPPSGAEDDGEIYRTLSAGGITVIRKGILEIPPEHPWFDDVCVGEQMKAKGYKVGYMKTVRMHHLGEYLSTTFPERSGITQFSEP